MSKGGTTRSRVRSWYSVAENASRALRKACGSSWQLVQRTWQDDAGNKRQTGEIQVTHVGPGLQFATAEVTKSTAEGSRSSSGEEKQTA